MKASHKLYITWLLLIWFALYLSSCGTRRATVDINKFSEASKEQSDSKGQVKKESSSESTKSSEEKANVVDEKQEQRTREIFDENGKLKERITELLNSKKTDNSSKSSMSKDVLRVNTDSVFNNTIYKTRTITKYVKAKDVEADKSVIGNFSIWGILGITLIVVAGVGIYFYLKK